MTIINKEIILDRIIKVIQEKKELSITELSRELNMNRTTLKYYLNFLQDRNVIKRKRIEQKERGRPTKIIFNPTGFEKWKESIMTEDITGLKKYILYVIDTIQQSFKIGRVKKSDYQKFKNEILEKLK